MIFIQPKKKNKLHLIFSSPKAMIVSTLTKVTSKFNEKISELFLPLNSLVLLPSSLQSNHTDNVLLVVYFELYELWVGLLERNCHFMCSCMSNSSLFSSTPQPPKRKASNLFIFWLIYILMLDLPQFHPVITS